MEHLKNHLEAVSLLKDLISIINCPDQVNAMHNMARQEMALTLDEKEKAEAARIIIMKYGQMTAEINMRNHDLSMAEKSITERESAVSKRETIIHAAEESVRIRIANQAEIDKRRLDERKQMDKDKAEFEKYEHENKIRISIDKDKIENDLMHIASEKKNIEAEKKTLNESIEKIRNRT